MMIYVFEFGIVQIKSVFLVLLAEGVSSSSSHSFLDTCILVLLTVDIGLSLVTVYTKITYINPYFPRSHPQSKIFGYSEFLIIILQTISAIFSTIEITETLSNELISYAFFSLIQLLCCVISLVLYIKELPFADRTIMEVFAKAIVFYYLFRILDSILSGVVYKMFWVFSIVAPILSRIIEGYFQRRLTKDNCFDRVSEMNYTSIMRFLTRGQDLEAESSFMKDIGALYVHGIKCKKINCFCKVVKEAIYSNINSGKLEDSKRLTKMISANILIEYMTHKRKDSYSSFLAIYWILDNHNVPKYLFGYLEDLQNYATSFNDKFFLMSIKTRISERLNVLYYSRELFFMDEKHKKLLSIWTESDLKGVTEQGVDLGYAIYYRRRLKKLTDMILEFSALNKEYIIHLRAKNTKMSKLHHLTEELFKKSVEIKEFYRLVELKSRFSDYTHLFPFYYFLMNLENMYLSAKKIASLYRTKLTQKVALFKEVMNIQTDQNLLNNAVVFCIESLPSKLGSLTDVYGCIDELYLDYKEIVGQHMNYLVMPGFVDHHTQSSLNFVTNEMIPLLGEAVRNSFIYLPKIDYIRPVNYNLKLLPTLDSDYQLVVGAKFVRMTSKVFILISPDDRVSAYSINWKNVFIDPKDFLKPRIHLKDLSQEMHEDIVRFNKNKAKKEQEINNNGHVNLADIGLERAKDKGDMVDIFMNMEGIESQSDAEIEDSVNKIEKHYKIAFISASSGRRVERTFKVSITFHSYLLSDCKYKLLSLVLDDSMPKTPEKRMKGSLDNSGLRKKVQQEYDPEVHNKKIESNAPIQWDSSLHFESESLLQDEHIRIGKISSPTPFKLLKDVQASSMQKVRPNNAPMQFDFFKYIFNTEQQESKKLDIVIEDEEDNCNSIEGDNIHPNKYRRKLETIEKEQGKEKILPFEHNLSINNKLDMNTSKMIGSSRAQDAKKFSSFEQAFKKMSLSYPRIFIAVLLALAGLLPLILTFIDHQHLLDGASRIYQIQKLMHNFMEFEHYSLLFYSTILDKIAIQKGIYSYDR